MKNCILNEAELRKSLFSPNPDFSSKYITLPNILVVRWVSFGFSFQSEFPLKTDDDYDIFVQWWILNRHGTVRYEKEILDYFLKNYHCLDSVNHDDVIRVTPLMELIWRRRKDLQELFVDINNTDRLSYWNWWFHNGWKECRLPTPVLFDFSNSKLSRDDVLKFFKELIWESDEIMQALLPKPLTNDKKRFVSWLNANGKINGFFNDELVGWFNGLDARNKLHAIEPMRQQKIDVKLENKDKVALIGHPTGMFGIGEDIRLIAKSMEAVGIDVDIYIACPDINVNKISYENASALSDYQGSYKANIFCLPVFDMLNVIFDHELNIFTSTINIGIWQWELSAFPQEAKFAFELVQHVWSISNFASKSIEGALDGKVDVLPLPVLKPVFEKKTRLYFQLPEKDFLYLFSYDGGSFVNRKNPLGVLEAFQRAFPSESDVCCVIKAIKSVPNDIWNECQRRALCDSRIYIIDAVLNRSDFLALMNVSDVVVSLHRAEGFGRLMAEAFLMEKPVIASGYSGNLDYMTNENSFIVEGEILPLFEKDYFFAKGKEWFEPDINQAAEHMRYVYFNRKESTEKAKKGKNEIEENYSIEKTGKVLRELLNDAVEVLKIKYFIDSPLENNVSFDRDFKLSGWAISKNKIKEVKVYINDSLYLNTITNIERDDVLNIFSKYPSDQKPGFSLNIDIEELKTGSNKIKITDQKDEMEHASLTVNRETSNIEYHNYYIAARNHACEVLKHRKRDDYFLKIIIYVVCDSFEGMKDTLSSLINQSYQNIEVKIVSSTNQEQVKNYLSDYGFSNIDVLGKISINDSHPDEYICFIVPGEIMDHISVEQWISEIQDKKPDLSYSDNDYYFINGLHSNPNFKPDWSYNYQLSKDYIGGIYFIKKTDEAVNKINSSIDTTLPAWRYDLFFKLLSDKVKIHHLPDVLWSAPVKEEGESDHNEKIKIALNHVNEHERKADVIENNGIYSIQWKLEVLPKVSIIVPTTGRPDILIPCISSIIDNTTYPNYELIFLDNGRGKYPEGINFLKEKGVKVIERNESFNWSRLNNIGVSESDGELLLFLNDDIEVTNQNWLYQLVRQAVRPNIGCVGGLLLYPDGKIQHAGVFLVDHGGGARHWLHFADPKYHVYQNLHKYVREVTANTGACLMMRREIFEEVNGFDEDLAIVGNDIDMCLRVSEKGYRNLWTPECSLIHHESVSRKEVAYTDDEKMMWERWEDIYLSGDPYYNPNLTLYDTNCELAPIKKLLYDEIDETENLIGVNLIGYIKAEMGVGEAARGVARVLNATKIPFCIINYEQGNPARMGDDTWNNKIVDKPKYGINVLHINADLTPDAVKDLPNEFFEDKYTIGFWAWELPDFPDEWLESFSYVDEVWVPSVFVKEAIEKKSPVPVTVMPHPIEKQHLPYLKREFFKLPSEVFLFLIMYDVHSIQERKNPMGAICAFKNAFEKNNVNVGLVIKVNNANEIELDELKQEMGDYQNIYIIAQTMNRYEVDSLIDCCDCFVSLHRSEGFGLVLAESMVMEKPVIATNWSGNVDFMNHNNSVCIDYKLKQLERDYGPYKAYQYWADPDLEQASYMMKQLVANPRYAKELGLKAKLFIDEYLSLRAVGLLMKNRIDQIMVEQQIENNCIK